MTCSTRFGAHVFTAACLLLVTHSFGQKVYFDCGAKVDMVDAQGLILSPGFPYNYSSGTHCVWQFVVPVDYQLILEIFDFDVFESHDSAGTLPPFSNFDEQEAIYEMTLTPSSLVGRQTPPEAKSDRLLSERASSMTQQYLNDIKIKQVLVQEQLTKMEMAKVSYSAQRSADALTDRSSPSQSSALVPPGSVPPEKNVDNNTTTPTYHLMADLKPGSNPSENGKNVPTTTAATTLSTSLTPSSHRSPETQKAVLDDCPHDVLYISDLITFSSRFCGTNRPLSSQLVFGSRQEMVEVIMELITTTHWGRGFALLFHYHNLTEAGAHRLAIAPILSKIDTALAAGIGAALVAMILMSILCIIFRPKLCTKTLGSSSSHNAEVPEHIPDHRSEVSELRIIAEKQPNVVTTAEHKTKENPCRPGCNDAQPAELDLSCTALSDLDLDEDEVFIVAPCLSGCSLSPLTKERCWRYSERRPDSEEDWTSPDAAGFQPSKDDGRGSSRPRAWSVRTFQDFLPPLPQLHKKWYSWNSTNQFTKLLDTVTTSSPRDGSEGDNRKVMPDIHLKTQVDKSSISDSSISNASCPITAPTQREHHLNSTINHQHSHLTGNCIGLLTDVLDAAKPAMVLTSTNSKIENGQAGNHQEFPSEHDHNAVPVFGFSEKEDRKPLVSAEHLNQSSISAVLTGLVRMAHDVKSPTAVESSNLSSERVRREWRLWGSQVSAGISRFPSSESNAITGQRPSLNPSPV